ncbi:MAG TPA: cell envelope integrity protein CreD, partial [Flavobacteriales bacterium]|nr:cell envelope integrity protein CreD [Flavobacteriales bacterium]
HLFHLLPEELYYSSDIFPETRHRGIFDVMVYKSDNIISGSFPKLDSSLIGNGNIEILWNKASINFGLSDLRGIQEEVYINWNNKKIPFNPGVSNENVFKSGIHIPILFNPGKNNDFSINLALNGSQQIDFLPLGKTTTIDLKSSWSSPKFVGAFIPDSYEIKDGFTAHYKQLHLNRNFPQYWSDSNHNIYDSAMGVELITPNDNYNKAIRSAKYAEMFIAFTFLVFFFFEVKNKKRIHPIQYILVGLALIINYTLLVSISEHISFNWAYIISAVATIALIGWYVHVILVKKQLTWLLIAILTMLYGFIFVILQLEDWALLAGSIGLFIVLTGVMYFSRKIDWYNLNSK